MSSSRPSGATVSPAERASRRWRPSSGVLSPDGRRLSTVALEPRRRPPPGDRLLRGSAARVDRRALPRRGPERQQVGPRQRTAGSARSGVRRRQLGHPRPGAARRGPGSHPVRRVVRGRRRPATTWMDRPTAAFAETYPRYFLLPRRIRPDAPWILCFGCDRGAYPGAQVAWEGDDGLSPPPARLVTIRAISGLFALHGALVVMGTALLWAFRGFTRWADVLRLTGLGYLVGVAAFGTVWTTLLVPASPSVGWAIVLSLLGGTAAAAVVAVRLGRERPRGFGRPEVGSSWSLLVTATGIAPSGLLLEAFFRSARLQSLQSFDAWAFWVPKAKAIYFFDGLDEQFFTTLAGRRIRRSSPTSMRPRSMRWEASTRSPSHLQFWFLVARRGRGGGGLPVSPRADRGFSGRRSFLARCPALRRPAPDPAGRHARRRVRRAQRAPARPLAGDEPVATPRDRCRPARRRGE